MQGPTNQKNSLARPAAPFIRVSEDRDPYLSFLQCSGCGAMFLEERRFACGKCGARSDFVDHASSLSGVLYSHSIVFRSYPGIPVPFISAIVDLDNGPSIKGNLRGISLDQVEIRSGMRVKVVFDDALGRTDADGNSYLSYFFEPEYSDLIVGMQDE